MAIQDERRRKRILDGNPDHFPLQGGGKLGVFLVQGIHMEAQAVRKNLHFDFLHHGRKQPEGIYETGIAVYLDVQVMDNAVVRPFFLAETLVRPGHLVEGIGQVEGHGLLLGI